MKHNYILYQILTLLIVTGISSSSSASLFFSKIDSFQVVIDKNQLILPNESFKIGIISFHKSKKTRKTKGMKGGSVLWWRYKVEVTGGTFSSGKIKINEKLMPSKGKFISIRITPRKSKELSKTILVPLNFETKIEFRPTTKFDKAPGCQFKGQIISTFNNGVTRVCKDLYRSRESKYFRIDTKGLSFKKGVFTIEPDFKEIENHTVVLFLSSLRNSSITNTFSVTLDYKHNYSLHFSGSSGSDGFQGSDGSNGYHGSDGTTGRNGRFGYSGPEIGVWTDLYLDSVLNSYLLYVITENLWTGEEYRYLINPDGGSFSVTSRGGSGGDGGNGGDGGDGRNGCNGKIWYEDIMVTKIVSKPFLVQVVKKVKKHKKDSDGNVVEYEEDVVSTKTVYRDVKVTEVISVRHQEPGENGGNGGDGGYGGFGGEGGDGGNIYLYFTEDSRIFENLIIARSIGGTGAKHGYGGDGGNGGNGGYGNPNGKNGCDGRNGSAVIGWADNGGNRKIYRESTEEFIFYEPQELHSENIKNSF